MLRDESRASDVVSLSLYTYCSFCSVFLDMRTTYTYTKGSEQNKTKRKTSRRISPTLNKTTSTSNINQRFSRRITTVTYTYNYTHAQT